MTDGDGTYRFTHEVDVRFRDIDIGGHAHHSQALIYIEEARAAYWREVVGRRSADVADIDYVLAEATVRWRRRVLYPDRLRVGVRVSRLGRKHFEMEYEVVSPERGLLVSAHTVQVMYDYAAESPRNLPGEVRRAVEALEGPFDANGRPLSSGG